jgi:glycosyltransferase involved in cell wall biosynthesis
MQTVHIVIPCYNEETRLPGDDLVDFVQENPWATVALVNDGSTDHTLDVLRGLAQQVPGRIFVHDLESNVGKAEAVRRGILESLAQPYEFVAYLDADFSTLPETLGAMFRWVQPQHRFILGSRVLRAGAIIERSAKRHYLGRIFATAASVALNLRLYDTQCGAKIIGRELVEPLFSEPFSSRWLFDLELLMRLRRLRGEEAFRSMVIEVPLERWVDAGNSRIRLRDLLRVPYELLRIRWQYRRLPPPS